MTKAEIKARKNPVKMKLRTGDKVMIIAGKDKGEVGFVAMVSPREQKAFVLKENPENPEQPLPLNAVVKHYKARYQGEKSRKELRPSPIHVSNLMLLDPKTGEPTRVGRKKEDGKIVRYAKKSGTTIKEEVPAKGDDK